MSRIILAAIMLVVMASPAFAQRQPHYKWDDPSYSAGSGDRSLYMSNEYNRKVNQSQSHQPEPGNHQMLTDRLEESGQASREDMRHLREEQNLKQQHLRHNYNF